MVGKKKRVKAMGGGKMGKRVKAMGGGKMGKRVKAMGGKTMKGKRVKAMGGKKVGMGKRVKARGGKKVGMGKRVKQRSGGATKRAALKGGGPAEAGITKLLIGLALGKKKMTPEMRKQIEKIMKPEGPRPEPLPRDFEPEYETGPYTPPKKPKKNTKVIEAAKKFAKKK